MKRVMALTAMACCALGGEALADGFIAMNRFSGGESVITFNTTDMGSLGHPTANIGSGISVTDSGGGKGAPGWRPNIDWGSLFDNIPGSSQGRALADSWGASDLKYNFTGAGSPQRVGLLLSTGTQTTWTVRVYSPANVLVDIGQVSMPGSQQAVFVGYERHAGVGYLRISDVENGFSTVMDDVRFEDAGPAIARYDITDAARSGFGSAWAHTYDGLITNTGNFFANGRAFTRANYRGGSGTLNDGSPGTSIGDTQLFANNSDARPRITLHLNGNHFIEDITLFSFDDGNSIPGCIRSVDVTIGGLTETFVTSEPTTNDEFIDLTGSVLSTIPTNSILLSNFVHDGRPNGLSEMFCIGEIGLFGTATTRFGLTATGPCPGSLNVNWSSAKPNVTLALIFAFNTGNFVIPFGPCQGTVLGLGSSQIQLVRTFNSGSGNGTLASFAPAVACRRYIQMHDLPACDLSNVFRLP